MLEFGENNLYPRAISNSNTTLIGFETNSLRML